MLHEAKRARTLLEDCRYALAELRSDPQGRAWRIRWFGTLAMLRAVGHVLNKVDAKSCSNMKKANSDWWKNLNNTKPNPAIFWKFIDSDRDLIVKEYDHRAAQDVTVNLGSGDVTYTYAMRGGPFDGEDPRDVVQKAIDWWEHELTEIETDAARRAQKQ
jgi:hypothetical protein